jgi:hypothetical protein
MAMSLRAGTQQQHNPSNSYFAKQFYQEQILQQQQMWEQL